MRILTIIVCLAILITGLYIRFNWDKYQMKSKCIMYERLLDDSFNDVITRKYEDENHGLKEKIQISDREISVFLDKSNFYVFVQPGDSIVKERGSGVIEVYRNGHFVKNFSLDFGCNQ